ncbi:unnamed protein product [Prorocentrum cordatum]|uniref:Uncharacterized protein n=1 Tax=Prorocentrum cordatum TaxID=2364126 RepID=A0ABN9V2I9_9DINO|nr:unnamed protein product [Polarella glacialis]
MLLAKLTESAKWSRAAPTDAVQVIDLVAHQFVPFTRACPVPDRVRGSARRFDPLTEDELTQLQRQATAPASLLGGVAPAAAGPQAHWIVADPGSDSFGQAVAVNPMTFAQKVPLVWR